MEFNPAVSVQEHVKQIQDEPFFLKAGGRDVLEVA